MLHLVQSVSGRITPEGIEACADILDISAAEVSGVATFYTMYKRKPVGDYHVGVCTNTLCAVMGGDAIFERLKEHLDVGNDETTDDGKDHPRARRVQRGLRLRAGDDGQLGVHGQHDPGVGHAAGRRPAGRHRGPLHPGPEAVHLARGRAGARRLPRRARRRGSGRRSRQPGRAEDRPRARLDGAAGRPGLGPRSSRPSRRADARPTPRAPTETTGRGHRDDSSPRSSPTTGTSSAPGRWRRTRRAAATARPRRRSAWRPTTSSRRSRTPACAAAAAPASRPA